LSPSPFLTSSSPNPLLPPRRPAPTPTSTSIFDPTWTPTPTRTATPTPTPTPACIIGAGPLSFFTAEPPDPGGEFSWSVTNLGSDPVRLTRLIITWPVGSPIAKMKDVQVNSVNVWSSPSGIDISPLTICEGCAEDFGGIPSYRVVNPGQTSEIRMTLSRDLNSGLYQVQATFLNLTTGGTCTAIVSSNFTHP
jgi:hypothetical protein